MNTADAWATTQAANENPYIRDELVTELSELIKMLPEDAGFTDNDGLKEINQFRKLNPDDVHKAELNNFDLALVITKMSVKARDHGVEHLPSELINNIINANETMAQLTKDALWDLRYARRS